MHRSNVLEIKLKEKEKLDVFDRGKTISGLIEELQSYENQGLAVEISLDGGATHKPISMLGKRNGVCLLIFHPKRD